MVQRSGASGKPRGVKKSPPTSRDSLADKVRALATKARAGLPARAAALREAASETEASRAGAREELKRLAHRLRGTAGSYGMGALSDQAAALEDAAAAGATDRELAEGARRLADACDAEALRGAPAGDASDEGGAREGAERAPRETGATQASERAASPRPDEPAGDAPPLALVVDDDPAIGRLVGLLLERMGGYAVEVKSSPLDALAWLDAGGAPILLVVDAMMPELDGRALALKVRSRAPFETLPVAVLSAATPEELGWTSESFAPDAWITKPVRAAELLAALRTLRSDP